jgi:hypothetical protein
MSQNVRFCLRREHAQSTITARCYAGHIMLTPPEMCNDPDAQVMQYGSQSANMGNHIYKTIAEWIYFQTYHCTGKLETKDIRTTSLIPAKISKDFFTITPAPFLLKKASDAVSEAC